MHIPINPTTLKLCILPKLGIRPNERDTKQDWLQLFHLAPLRPFGEPATNRPSPSVSIRREGICFTT
jgi:hypothetical protein